MLRRLLATLFSGPHPAFELPPDEELEVRPSGLRVQLLEPGAGDAPAPTDVVTVRYAGWTLDGKRFDSCHPGTATFPLDRVVKGWTEGLQLLRPGGRARLVLPPHLAYGPRGAPPRIGPNATLLFDVELVRVEP